MRLLSCYIAGFGKFQNRAFDLSGKIVVFKEENGWGKTTLADFIKCMLYGMDAGRGKAVAANDRLRYEPWQGGAYGGSLVFSVAGKTYRVERSFGRTPAQDVGRVFDGNNLLSYEFGERAEFLGEKLFGMNAESYQRTVYVPQGEIPTEGLPEDLKGRLLALLSADGSGESGGAIARLDEAERALRAKRKPAKGKLDTIDEQLEILARQEQASENNLSKAKEIRGIAAGLETRMRALSEKLQSLRAAIEEKSRQNERAAKRETLRELELGAETSRQELQTLRAFFGATDPKTLNVSGLEQAVSEFYSTKERVEELERRCLDENLPAQDTSALETEAELCRQKVAEYEAAMWEDGVGKPVKPKTKTMIPPKRKSNFWILLIALFCATFGAIYCGSKPAIGLALLGVGALGLVFVFFRTLPRKIVKDAGENPVRTATDDVDLQLAIAYEAAKTELNGLLQKIQTARSDARRSQEELLSEREALRGKLAGLETGIRNFLGNFHFAELYDYRAAVTTLKANMSAVERAETDVADYERRLREFTADVPQGDGRFAQNGEYFQADMQTLKLESVATERELAELAEQRALSIREAENFETAIDPKDLLAQRAFLEEEKARLEKRYTAVRAAKELLLRAKENMASKYLEPVAKGSRAYLAMLATDGEKTLRFTGEGAPVFEDYGGLREMAYYSKGSKELTGLCVRLALADAVFQKEPPPLILDDPFVNLDDEKTERAKALARKLAERYQILYFTCKEERKL